MLANSPLADVERYEPQHGLPTRFLRRLNSTNPDTNGWARHEHRDVDEAGCRALFEAEATASAHLLTPAMLLTFSRSTWGRQRWRP